MTIYRQILYAALIALLTLSPNAVAHPSTKTSWSTPADNAADTTPSDFYLQLARSIKKAEGKGLIYLTAGYYRTDVDDVVIIWGVEDKTRADVGFSYEDHYLKEAKIQFKPPLHVKVLGPKPFEGFVDDIEYDFSGRATKATIRPAQPSSGENDPSAVASILLHLEMNKRAGKLFEGVPLKNWEGIVQCDPNGNPISGAKPAVSEMQFFNREGKPGLLVELGDDFVVRFSSNTFVHLGASSSVRFDEITYSPISGSVDGILAKLDFRLRGGHFSTGDVAFDLGSDAQLLFGQVNFRFRNGSGTISAKDGVLEGVLRRGSKLWITRGIEHPSYLNFDDGSNVKLLGFELAIKDSHLDRIKIANGSSLSANVWDGQLSFGSNTNFEIDKALVEMRFTHGDWQDGAKPNVSATLPAVSVDLRGGQFQFNAISTVAISSGQVRGIDLTLNTASKRPITGSLSTLIVELREGSKLGVPGSLRFSTRAGATVKSASTLMFEQDSDLPIGELNLDIPFQEFKNSDTTLFRLENGKVVLPMQIHKGGIVSSPTIVNSTGQLEVDETKLGKLENADLMLKSNIGDVGARVNFTSLKMPLRATPDTPYVEGIWSGEIKDIRFEFMSEQKGVPDGFDADNDGNNNADARLYACQLDMLTCMEPDASKTFKDVKVAFDTNSLKCDPIDMPFTFRLKFREGTGWYSNAEHPELGGTKEGDYANWQCLFSDTILGDRLYLMLAPKEYVIDCRLKLDVTSQAIDGSVTGLSIRGGFPEGGSYAVEGTDVGATAAKIVLEIVSWFGGNDMGDLIDTAVQKSITDLKLEF